MCAPLRFEPEQVDTPFAISGFKGRGFAFDTLGMKEIATGKRADIGRIGSENGAAKCWLDVESRAMFEHDDWIARKAP